MNSWSPLLKVSGEIQNHQIKTGGTMVYQLYLNSEFSFYIDCHTKAKELNLPYYLLIIWWIHALSKGITYYILVSPSRTCPITN